LDVVEDLSWMEFSSEEIGEASSTVQAILTPADGTPETSPTDQTDESSETQILFETEATVKLAVQ
jgi:hypothetical protein